MKVVISIQAKASASRGLVHYIAHSKLDPAKEAQQRDIFNGFADDLGVSKANDLLQRGISAKRAANEELHHLVISIKPEDFEKMGSNESERRQALKDITRAVMKTLQTEIGADKLDWAAGIHRNTGNPHVHIAIQKEFFNKDLEKETLTKFSGELLPHYVKSGSGEKSFEKTLKNGLLIDAAAQKLEELLIEKRGQNALLKQESHHQQPISLGGTNEKELPEQNRSESEIRNERNILAQALLAKYYLDRSRENLALLEEHGDKRRFTIYDEFSQKKRKLSLFDLERRAENHAIRQIKTQNPADAEKTRQLKKDLVETELNRNENGLKRIKAILFNLRKTEYQRLAEREEEYGKVEPIAEKVRQEYRRENLKLPVPLLSPKELKLLQADALEKRNIRAAVYLERVRQELSKENGRETRTDDEISRLKATKILSTFRVDQYEKDSRDFNDRRHSLQFEIDGKKYSLREIDSLIKESTKREQGITQRIRGAFGKIGFAETKTTLKKLEGIKAEIIQKSLEKANQIERTFKAERSLLKILNQFYKNESNPDKEALPAKFSAAELAELESMAIALKSADLYRENWEQQKQLLETANSVGKNESKNSDLPKENLLAGRAIAREIVAGIEAAKAKDEYERFIKFSDYQKFEIKSESGEASRFVSLVEIGLNRKASILDQTLEYFLESRNVREARREVEQRIEQKAADLKENAAAAKKILHIAREIANQFKPISSSSRSIDQFQPVFTPKELISIESRILQTTNKVEAEKLQKILDPLETSQQKSLAELLRQFEDPRATPEPSESFSLPKEERSVQKDNSDLRSFENEAIAEQNKNKIPDFEKGR